MGVCRLVVVCDKLFGAFEMVRETEGKKTGKAYRMSQSLGVGLHFLLWELNLLGLKQPESLSALVGVLQQIPSVLPALGKVVPYCCL